MSDPDGFDLDEFLPYLLNRAAERTSREFQSVYKSRYGMLRTEWRALFHLGRHGAMTAREICDRTSLHKTKVSRAVKALETRRYLTRTVRPDDRRHEMLELTAEGRRVHCDLCASARACDAQLAARFSAAEDAVLRRCLARLAEETS